MNSRDGKAKRCPQCETVKPLREFPKSKGRADGHNQWCKPCTARKGREYRNDWDEYRRADWLSQMRERRELLKRKDPAAFKQAQRVKHLKYYFGLDAGEDERLFEAQGRVCAICGRGESVIKRWVIDHCHDSGVVRGVLCYRCNHLLGCATDDPAILQNAIEYLRGVK